MVRSGPFTRAGNRQASAVDAEMKVVFFSNLLEVTDPNPVPVLAGVVTKPSGAADFDLARDGSLVYVAGQGAGATGIERTLV